MIVSSRPWYHWRISIYVPKTQETPELRKTSLFIKNALRGFNACLNLPPHPDEAFATSLPLCARAGTQEILRKSRQKPKTTLRRRRRGGKEYGKGQQKAAK
jgi:hypothetical protein